MPTHRTCLLLALLATIALPAAAQKTHIDFDGATAFNQYKTFQFQEARRDEMMGGRAQALGVDFQRRSHAYKVS